MTELKLFVLSASVKILLEFVDTQFRGYKIHDAIKIILYFSFSGYLCNQGKFSI